MLREGKADLQQKGHLKEYLYMEDKKELGQTEIRLERGSTEGRTMHTKSEKQENTPQVWSFKEKRHH